MRSAVITGPNIVSMESESLQDFDDFTDCTMVSSLNADREANRFKQPGQWFNGYGSCLDWIGWEPVGNTYTRRQDVIWGNVVQTYLQSVSARQNFKLGSPIINVLVDSFNAINNNSTVTYALDKETAKGELFQVTPLWRDRTGKLRMQVSRLQLVTRARADRFLFARLEDRSASLLQYYAEFVLNEKTLNEKRGLIQQKLRENTMARFKLRLSASRA